MRQYELAATIDAGQTHIGFTLRIVQGIVAFLVCIFFVRFSSIALIAIGGLFDDDRRLACGREAVSISLTRLPLERSSLRVILLPSVSDFRVSRDSTVAIRGCLVDL
jgi:hypothetical protein